MLRLLVWLLLVVTVTLFPFDFQAPADLEQALDSFWPTERPTDREVVLNVLLFVPLGAWLHHRGQHRSGGRMLIVVAGAVGLLTSLTVEGLQVFLPRRGSSVVDLVSNTAGALVGASGYRACGARVEVGLARLRGQASPALLVGVMLGFTVVALATSGALQLRTRLSDWSAEYPLLIGNEETGDRPWRGRIFELELTDAATPAESVHRFAVGESLKIPGTRIAVFDFSGSPPYRDAAGTLPSLDWTERPNDFRTTRGISLPGWAWLRTEGPASALADRLRESNAFTLRVLCATDDLKQGGPARIVSNSLDVGLRNFTLGQRGRDMVFRFRNPHNGLNGSRPEVVMPHVFSDNQPREILVTYDGATLLVAVARSDRVHRTELTPGSSLVVERTSVVIEADELQMLGLAYLVALFSLPGVLVGLLGRTRRERVVVGIVWVLVFTVLLEGTLVLASGRPFEWRSVCANSFVGTAVLSVAVTLSNVGGLDARLFASGMRATETHADA